MGPPSKWKSWRLPIILNVKLFNLYPTNGDKERGWAFVCLCLLQRASCTLSHWGLSVRIQTFVFLGFKFFYNKNLRSA